MFVFTGGKLTIEISFLTWFYFLINTLKESLDKLIPNHLKNLNQLQRKVVGGSNRSSPIEEWNFSLTTISFVNNHLFWLRNVMPVNQLTGCNRLIRRR